MGEHDSEPCEVPPANLGEPTGGLVGKHVRRFTDDLEKALRGPSQYRIREERVAATFND